MTGESDGTIYGLTKAEYASALDGGSEADVWARHVGDFRMPAGYHDDPGVRRQIGEEALEAELSSGQPDPGRVAALQDYISRNTPDSPSGVQ